MAPLLDFLPFLWWSYCFHLNCWAFGLSGSYQCAVQWCYCGASLSCLLRKKMLWWKRKILHTHWCCRSQRTYCRMKAGNTQWTHGDSLESPVDPMQTASLSLVAFWMQLLRTTWSWCSRQWRWYWVSGDIHSLPSPSTILNNPVFTVESLRSLRTWSGSRISAPSSRRPSSGGTSCCSWRNKVSRIVKPGKDDGCMFL